MTKDAQTYVQRNKKRNKNKANRSSFLLPWRSMDASKHFLPTINGKRKTKKFSFVILNYFAIAFCFLFLFFLFWLSFCWQFQFQSAPFEIKYHWPIRSITNVFHLNIKSRLQRIMKWKEEKNVEKNWTLQKEESKVYNFVEKKAKKNYPILAHGISPYLFRWPFVWSVWNDKNSNVVYTRTYLQLRCFALFSSFVWFLLLFLSTFFYIFRFVSYWLRIYFFFVVEFVVDFIYLVSYFILLFLHILVIRARKQTSV